MKIKNRVFLLVAMMIIALAPMAIADDWYDDTPGYYTVMDEMSEELFVIGSYVYIGDEYISGNDNRYEIVSVDRDSLRAYARIVEYAGSLAIDDRAFAIDSIAKEEKDNNSNKIGLYCTHSDESYVPTDGTESQPEQGGIFDVTSALQEALEERGCEVLMSDTPHEPHDSGAYRRSRQTAVDIMEDIQPTILADIHRDAVPPEVYEEEVNGEKVSKVRIVVGASNQNKSANEDFAKEIKQIADDKYPGLIKDIYIGKGSYNQDLMPQCILFEMGTHTIDKQLAEDGAVMLADVLATQMGLEAPKSDADSANKDAATDQSENQEQNDTIDEPQGQQQSQQSAQKDDKGIWKSILTIFAVISIAGIAILFIYNSKGERGQKFKSFWHEITGIGSRKRK